MPVCKVEKSDLKLCVCVCPTHSALLDFTALHMNRMK